MSCIWAESSKQVGNLFSVYVHQCLDHIIKHVDGLHDVPILKKKKEFCIFSSCGCVAALLFETDIIINLLTRLKELIHRDHSIVVLVHFLEKCNKLQMMI